VDGTHLLELRGIRKRFGANEVLRGLDLTVERGETLALVGPSGCGKTTLLRIIAGLEQPDSGEVILDGRVLASPRGSVPPERRRVGLVFQEYALFPHLDVAANVAFGIPRGVDKRRRVAELLDLVGLSGAERRMPHELSGGQQQRVALARTLAAEPVLVLLDEPFSNLDAGLRARVREDVLRILRTAGITAIVVTHDQKEALSLPGRVAVLIEGQIAQVGTAEEVYRRPATRAVAEFVGEANFLPVTRIRDGIIEFELGCFRSPTPPGGRFDVMLRPEELALAADGIPARVVGLNYFGHDQLITLALPSGTTVRVRTLGPGRPEPGSTVGVRVAGEPRLVAER
jgi:iron(III) transport system ATP-binding protein